MGAIRPFRSASFGSGHMAQIFRETPPAANPAGTRIDSKRRRKLMAMGHKADDHEDELNNKYQHHAM